jgi:hypothetical protein
VHCCPPPPSCAGQAWPEPPRPIFPVPPAPGPVTARRLIFRCCCRFPVAAPDSGLAVGHGRVRRARMQTGRRPPHPGPLVVVPGAPRTSPGSRCSRPPRSSTETRSRPGRDERTLTLRDSTQGWNQTTTQTSATAQLGSGEVITEAPAVVGLRRRELHRCDRRPHRVRYREPQRPDHGVVPGRRRSHTLNLTADDAFSVTWDSSGTTAGATPAPTAAATSPGRASRRPGTATIAGPPADRPVDPRDHRSRPPGPVTANVSGYRTN